MGSEMCIRDRTWPAGSSDLGGSGEVLTTILCAAGPYLSTPAIPLRSELPIFSYIRHSEIFTPPKHLFSPIVHCFSKKTGFQKFAPTWTACKTFVSRLLAVQTTFLCAAGPCLSPPGSAGRSELPVFSYIWHSAPKLIHPVLAKCCPFWSF